MSRPVITVCVVTFNQRSYIETCLRSILDQVVDADLQVLVGDDASTDGTSDIIKALADEYGSNIQCYVRTSNMGPASNMCDLISRAHGDFLARVDGDDFWLPGKLAYQLRYLAENHDCDVVYTNALVVDEMGNRVGIFNDLGDEKVDLIQLLKNGNNLNNSSVLFRAKNAHFWSERADCIDYEVHLSQARFASLGHIGVPLSAYRVNSHGSMIFSDNERVRELYWQAIQSVPRHLISQEDYARAVTSFLRRVFFRAVRTHNPGLFLRWAKCVYRSSPCGILHTTALLCVDILRMIRKVVVSKLSADESGKTVLYPR